MNTLKKKIKIFIPEILIKTYAKFRVILKNGFVSKKELGEIGLNSTIDYPCYIGYEPNIYIENNVRLQSGVRIINSEKDGKIYIKKYTSGGFNLTIITGNHTPTVGIPQFLLGPSHINDKAKDIIIEEDVWIGANIILLPGAHIGRGAVIGAGSLINKEIPPYAVVVGSPAKIIATKFSKKEIIEHERILYQESERLKEKDIDFIFEKYYNNLPSIGTSKITKEDLNTLDKIKRKYNYIEIN